MKKRSEYFPRLLRAQTLTVSFKKPFDLLAENTVAVRNALRLGKPARNHAILQRPYFFKLN
jgi:hypothetical protein